MAILNSEHFFEQAAMLIAAPSAEPLRQVDLRRAVSSAYYGLFHYTMTGVADEFVGAASRSSARYALFYRAVDHRRLREICEETRKTSPGRLFANYVPSSGWEYEIQDFSSAAVELQERRLTADYDPRPSLTTSDADVAIQLARSAVRRFDESSAEARKTFLALLVCPPR